MGRPYRHARLPGYRPCTGCDALLLPLSPLTGAPALLAADIGGLEECVYGARRRQTRSGCEHGGRRSIIAKSMFFWQRGLVG
jgi:hypothetical protein